MIIEKVTKLPSALKLIQSSLRNIRHESSLTSANLTEC